MPPIIRALALLAAAMLPVCAGGCWTCRTDHYAGDGRAERRDGTHGELCMIELGEVRLDQAAESTFRIRRAPQCWPSYRILARLRDGGQSSVFSDHRAALMTSVIVRVEHPDGTLVKEFGGPLCEGWNPDGHSGGLSRWVPDLKLERHQDYLVRVRVEPPTPTEGLPPVFIQLFYMFPPEYIMAL